MYSNSIPLKSSARAERILRFRSFSSTFYVISVGWGFTLSASPDSEGGVHGVVPFFFNNFLNICVKVIYLDTYIPLGCIFPSSKCQHLSYL